VLLTSANKIGYANYGIGAELRALAAAVVGGASLAGGAGNIFGTFLGVLMLALIGNGFVMLNELVAWRPGVARRRVEAISLKRRARIWLARTRAFG